MLPMFEYSYYCTNCSDVIQMFQYSGVLCEIN